MDKFSIIPTMKITSLESDSKDNAIVDFATGMDSDMNTYFRAVPEAETSTEITRLVTAMINAASLSAEECSDIFNALGHQAEVIGGKL